MAARRMFSICIPAYNRARFLEPLLQSVFSQDCSDFEIVICEDLSPERPQIAAIVRAFDERHPGTIRYHENNSNVGYDANVRGLVERASGRYCFFMGNDDLLCPGALTAVADLLGRHQNVGVVLKSYAWFDETPARISQTVRYYAEERAFRAGPEAIRACYRRSGVIAGYIVDRDAAQAAATSRFDGTLYYQMHLTARVLIGMDAVFTPEVLVLCRNSEPPDFGHSGAERGRYVPGRYSPQARLNMVGGALSIVRDLRRSASVDVVEAVTRDYANYFYPYIRDQLQLPAREYWKLYRGFGRLGLDRYPMFHLYCLVAYVLGASRFDGTVRLVRRVLGRSPRFT